MNKDLNLAIQKNVGFILVTFFFKFVGSFTMIPIRNQNTQYKSFLFPFFCVKNYYYNYGYTKNFCLEKEKYIPIYLSGILVLNWYNTYIDH
jgi:hypothetical protein